MAITSQPILIKHYKNKEVNHNTMKKVLMFNNFRGWSWLKSLDNKDLLVFNPGDCTKKFHIEHNQFPKSLEFEKQFYKDTIEMLASRLDKLREKNKRRILTLVGWTLLMNLVKISLYTLGERALLMRIQT